MSSAQQYIAFIHWTDEYRAARKTLPEITKNMFDELVKDFRHKSYIMLTRNYTNSVYGPNVHCYAKKVEVYKIASNNVLTHCVTIYEHPYEKRFSHAG